MICKPFHFHTVSKLFTLLCEWTARDAAGGSWTWTDGLGKSSEKRGEGPRGGGLGVGALCEGCGSLRGCVQGFCLWNLCLEFVDTDVGVRSSWYLITPSPASVTGKM